LPLTQLEGGFFAVFRKEFHVLRYFLHNSCSFFLIFNHLSVYFLRVDFPVLHLSSFPFSSKERESETVLPNRARRRWTKGELTEAISALAALKTADVAAALGINPKALRSLLRRNGISLRALRQDHSNAAPRDGGITVRRSSLGIPATYGALALADLHDNACRWPIGDPVLPDFSFCGCKRVRRSPYCAEHRARSLETVTPHASR
jgi:hypothetical protein